MALFTCASVFCISSIDMCLESVVPWQTLHVYSCSGVPTRPPRRLASNWLARFHTVQRAKPCARNRLRCPWIWVVQRFDGEIWQRLIPFCYRRRCWAIQLMRFLDEWYPGRDERRHRVRRIIIFHPRRRREGNRTVYVRPASR